MMSTAIVREKIRIGIADSLEEEGFIYIRSNERIMRKSQIGFDVIHITIINAYPIFEVEISLRTRINQVEEIVNMFMEDHMNPKYMPLTETIAISYEELTGSENNFIEIKSDYELKKAIFFCANLIRDKGFEFFNNNEDINKVNQLKKHRIIYEHGGLSRHHNRRSLMTSLVLMKLCNDPDFDLLRYKYKELYVPFDGEEISGPKAIDDLISYLENM